MLHSAADHTTPRVSRVIQRTPFFYGWVVLAAGSLGMIMTSPGQTFAISIFIDYFIVDLGISRSVVSSFYAVGTLAGSMALPFVGRMVDRRGPRIMVAVISGVFGLGCIYMSIVQTGWMLLIGFVLLRMFGQGSLQLVSTYTINQWWVRQRGTILGISGVLMALLGVGLSPNLVNWMIPEFGWRMTYVILGLALLIIMVPVGLTFFRERPEYYGLRPDGNRFLRRRPAVRAGRLQGGGQKGQEEEDEFHEENWTAKEATRTGAFWIICMGLASMSMLGTGLTFHMVSIFEDNQLSSSAAAAVFVPIAVTTAVVNLGSGILIDRLPVRLLLALSLILMAAALWMAQFLTGATMALFYGMIMGGMMGMQRTVTTVAWAAYFGRLHLGSITGISTTILAASSALGPMPMGVARDIMGEYNMALSILSLLPLSLAVVSLFMRTPVKPSEPAAAGSSGFSGQ